MNSPVSPSDDRWCSADRRVSRELYTHYYRPCVRLVPRPPSKWFFGIKFFAHSGFKIFLCVFTLHSAPYTRTGTADRGRGGRLLTARAPRCRRTSCAVRSACARAYRVRAPACYAVRCGAVRSAAATVCP